MGFDGGPVANRQVIPGYVVGVGELDEVFEAEDTDDGDAVSRISMCSLESTSCYRRKGGDLQAATEEHDDDSQFASPTHVENCQLLHGKGDNDQVQKNV